MSIDRQFGVHELPGTEEPAPQPKTTVSAGFELQMRGYVNAIWAKLAELEGKIDDFEGWRTTIALALKDVIDPRDSSSRPRLVSDAAISGGKGRAAASPRLKPWEQEGVSRRTWFRRRKEGAP